MKDMRAGLLQLQQLRERIEEFMEALPDRFNQAVGHSRLRLRAWRRSKDLPPYAVYWVMMNRRRLATHNWGTLEPCFPFRRQKIHTRQDLDDAIFFGMATKVRRIVYRFNAQRTALNAAHAAISEAVEGFRKMLWPFDLVTSDLEHADNFSRVLSLLTDLEFSLGEAQTALQRLDLDMRIYSHLPLRLVYEQDAGHPYGRLRWRWVRDGKPEGPLTDRRKRSLGLDRQTRRELTPFERRRRLGMRRLQAITDVLRRLKCRISPALQKTLALLEPQSIVIPLESLSARKTA